MSWLQMASKKINYIFGIRDQYNFYDINFNIIQFCFDKKKKKIKGNLKSLQITIFF